MTLTSTEQDMILHDTPQHDTTGQSMTGRDGTGRDGMGWDRTGQDKYSIHCWKQWETCGISLKPLVLHAGAMFSPSKYL